MAADQINAASVDAMLAALQTNEGVRNELLRLIMGAALGGGGGTDGVVSGEHGGSGGGGLGGSVPPTDGSELREGSVKSEGSVEMPDGVKVGEGVRSKVSFGSSDEEASGDENLSFMPRYVNCEPAKEFYKTLAQITGFKIHRQFRPEFALCMFDAASVPEEFLRGKTKLRSYEAVGDSVITYHLARAAIAEGMTVAELQTRRSSVTANGNLVRVFCGSRLRKHVTFGGSVTTYSKSYANALEAIVGVVDYYQGSDASYNLLVSLQIIKRNR